MNGDSSPGQGMTPRAVPPWPETDAEGRPVRFATRDAASRRDDPEPVLAGTTVRLEPLREAHLDALCAIGLEPSVTRFMPVQLRTRELMAAYVRDAVAARAAGTAVPFVIALAGAKTVVGTTRYMAVDRANRRLEIGSTWIGRDWQRTGVNTEAKYLLLSHAFEERGCLRVEFKTDSLNERSRAALLRIGAVQEGVFRSHLITDEGRVRHSVCFSITAEEWPVVRQRLEALLNHTRAQGP
jgi:RimJ/RimL family protein N-acetyltransferase